jgi:Uma2 family endonuclease
MTDIKAADIRWTVRDLDLFPDPIDDTRYEIIGGKLHVSHQPHWRHQLTTARALSSILVWSDENEAGVVLDAPGVIFSEEDAVAPDVVWVSADRFSVVAAEDGKLHVAPDLVVEVLSPGRANETRDREAKLDVYSRYGVREYWIVNWQDRSVQIFRRENQQLRAAATFAVEDTLMSPLLPGFALPLQRLFAPPL